MCKQVKILERLIYKNKCGCKKKIYIYKYRECSFVKNRCRIYMSNCVICGIYPGINYSKRIDVVNNGPTDSNGMKPDSSFIYTSFPGNVCSYCDTNIRDSNKNQVILNLQSNGWIN